MALSDFLSQLAVALWNRQAQMGLTIEDQSASNEALEWSTLFWKQKSMVGMLAHISELPTNKVDHLIDWFCLDFRKCPVDIKGVGDGYFPPFVRLTNSIFLAPDCALAFLQSRNLLYVLQRRPNSVQHRLITCVQATTYSVRHSRFLIHLDSRSSRITSGNGARSIF